MEVKVFIKNVVANTKNYIEKFEEYKELTGEQKKARLDDIIKEYIEATIDTIGLNFIFKFVIKKVLIDNLPIITQAIFDLLKAKVEGVTKDA